MRGSNLTLNGKGRVLAVSVNAIVSIGAEGSSEILKAHSNKAVVKKRELGRKMTDQYRVACWYVRRGLTCWRRIAQHTLCESQH